MGHEDMKIYKLPMEEARERGETEMFFASHRRNVACRAAIETAIRENFNGTRLSDGCEAGILAEFGRERVEWVLANTLRQKQYDGRFSKANREWADALPVPATNASGGDLRWEFVVQSHPAVLDGFVNLVRQGRELEKRKEAEVDKKRSVVGQLAAPTVSGEQPAAKTKKDREVR